MSKRPTKAGVIVLSTTKPISVALVKGNDYKRDDGSVIKGKWGFPKGSIEFKETAKKAALREFEEETSIKILEPSYDLTLYLPDKTDPKLFYIHLTNNKFNMKPQLTEVKDAKWVKISDLSQNKDMYTFDVRVLHNIIMGKSKIPDQIKLQKLIERLLK